VISLVALVCDSGRSQLDTRVGIDPAVQMCKTECQLEHETHCAIELLLYAAALLFKNNWRSLRVIDSSPRSFRTARATREELKCIDLTLRRVVYEGKTYPEPKEQRRIPIMDVELVARLKKLEAEREWVFQSRNGVPVNPNNIRRRFLKPISKELGIALSGWHDFRFSLATELRRTGTHPKVISDLLGHKRLNLAMGVYNRSDLGDFEKALGATVVGSQLLPKQETAVKICQLSVSVPRHR
jgi:Phage integrase family